MAKNLSATVRSHEEEREWLRSLGDGSIVEGVRHLIQQSREEAASGSSSHPKDKHQSSKQ